MKPYALKSLLFACLLLWGAFPDNAFSQSAPDLPEPIIEDSFKRGSLKEGALGKAEKLDEDSDPLTYPIPRKVKLYDHFTIMAWICPEKYPDGARGTFDSRSPMTVFDLLKPGTRVLLRLHRGKPQMAFMLNNNKWKELTASSSIAEAQWAHVAIVRKQSELRIYVNGRLEAIDRQPDAKLAEWQYFTLGSQYNSSDRRFIGSVDEVRCFDRALDEGQIRKLREETGRDILEKLTPSAVDPKSVDSWMSFGLYPSLRLVDEALHPHIDQLSMSAMIAPWQGASNKDLIVSANERNLFGTRIGIFTQVGRDDRGLPVYDEGRTLPGLTGTRFQAIKRPDGLFDLIARGDDTPYGAKNLVHYVNRGSPGAPEFAEYDPVLIDERFISEALGNRELCGWSFNDVDGDGIPDLLLAAGERKFPYLPDRGSLYSGEILPNTGPGRGYDIEGNWLGGTLTSRLLWGKGSYDSRGRLVVSPLRIVHYRHPGFAVQWVSTASERAMTVLELEDRRYLVCTGNVDRILAMPLVLHNGELICGTARPLLRNKITVQDTYIIQHITVHDLDDDGQPELLLDGNPGRVAVLKGNRIGGFEEIGSLRMKGGPLAVDTLAVQNRADFDGDGFPDLIIGDSSGLISFWPGTKDPMLYGAPVYMTSMGRRIQHQAGMTGSIQGPSERRWGYTNPTVGDWNDDGKLEMIVIDIAGRVTCYEQGKSPTDMKHPRLLTLRGELLPAAWRVKPQILGKELNFSHCGKPALLYIDWEGDLAVAIPSEIGGVEMESSVKLKHKNGKTIPMCGPVGAWGRTKFSLTDWDGDGKWDLIFSTNRVGYKFITDKNPPNCSTPMWIRNLGTNEEPLFDFPRLITLKDGTMIDFGVHVASPEASDMNGDGKPDLLLGGEDGKVYYFNRDNLKW